MPPKLAKPSPGLDRQRRDVQECWIDPKSKYLNYMVLLFFYVKGSISNEGKTIKL